MPITTTAPAVELPNTGVSPVHAVAAVVHAANVQAAQAAAAAPVVAEAVQVQAAAPAVAVQAAAVLVGEPVASAVDAGGATSTAVDPTTPDAGPTVELTASQKLAAKIESKKVQVAKLVEEIAKLEQQFRAADLLDAVKEGSVIIARVGRAETAREVEASVIGVQTLPNGDRRLKIFFGEGFDSETVVIQDSQIIDVKQA